MARSMVSRGTELSLRLLVHRAQGRVHLGVAAPFAGRHLDLADQLAEELAPLGVGGALLVLDGRPLGMAGSCFGHLSSVERFQEHLVQAQVVGQLGVERRHHDRAVATEHGLAVHLGQDLDAGARATPRPAPG